ncbi:response regulator transcription factor [Alicyclobacillus sp. SO9]|uniref:response regulator n=1 Tax=Alicyclobacillus sp. SO9 TaxID=2665646 RepID=UPI001E4A130A|nr:response regulator transcription factor [Alicyclobacillus sp. SO9]
MSSDKHIKIAIADDNDHFRDTLRDVLQYEPDFQVVALWPNGLDVMAGLETIDPDILLLDINMPFLNGVETTKQLQEKYPKVKIIILSMHDDEGYVLETLRSGASGYLVKDGSAVEVIRAVREVAAGRAIVHPQVTQTVLSQFYGNSVMNDSWREVLTNREMEVLQELALGKSNEDISAALGITTKTVKSHVSNILSKLEVSDRTQAVILALRNHWLPA